MDHKVVYVYCEKLFPLMLTSRLQVGMFWKYIVPIPGFSARTPLLMVSGVFLVH